MVDVVNASPDDNQYIPEKRILSSALDRKGIHQPMIP